MRTQLLSIVVLLALSTAAPAQPTAFTYQGHLKSGAQPATGLHDMRFRLWRSPAGGAQIGSIQCADDVAVTAGLFTATIDFGQQFASPEDRFLEIEVRADTGLGCASVDGFVVLAPRQPLTAAPRASHAKTAFALAAADGSPIDAVVVGNTGNVGIGTPAPAAPLHLVAPNTGPTPGEGIRIQGALATGANVAYLSFANGAGTALGYVGDGGGGENNIYLGAYGADIGLVNSTFGTVLTAKTTGLVGIGTISPAAKLDVRGDVRLGASGEFFAVKSPQNDRILRGFINANGTINAAQSSSGFTVTLSATGVYVINFSQPFTSAPTMVVGSASQCCKPRHNGVSTTSAVVHQNDTVSPYTLTNSPFSFIIIGQ